MKARFPHHSAEVPERPADNHAGEGKPIALTARACCCPAPPVVTVLMPPTATRPHPVDLLLCRHHYRVSRAALTTAGAVAYDEIGALINPDAKEPELAGSQPADASPGR